MEFETFYHR